MIEKTHVYIDRYWDSVVHFIPEKQKLDAEVDFIKTLDSKGVEESEIKACADYDPKLEEAVNTVFQDNEDEEQYDDRYEDN